MKMHVASIFMFVALLVQSVWSQTSYVIQFSADPTQNGGLGINSLQCAQGKIQATVNLLASVDINNIFPYQPMTQNGLAVISATFLLNGAPTAVITIQNAFNVASSTVNANVWTFGLQNDGPHPGAVMTLGTCTGTTVPAVTVSFSTNSVLTTQGLPNGANGGPPVPAVTNAVPVIVNALPPQFSQPFNTGCYLQVPNDPLSAAGLATPYLLSGTQGGVPCIQGLGSGSFVQGVVLDLDTGALAAYNPLVINAGTMPAIMPTPPVLPANNIVGLWFGSNLNVLQLTPSPLAPGAAVDSLVQGVCVNGGGQPFSLFGQFAACNARAWFDAANSLIAAGKLVIPPLGVDFLGKTCPSTHDFSIVDQDPSDNTDTKYIVTSNGQTAQFTPANVASLTAAKTPFTVFDNGSDELLVTLVNNAINCTNFLIKDLADATGVQKIPTLATNELRASLTAAPRAFVENSDPMTLTGSGLMSLNKLNAYRTSVGQPPVSSLAAAATAPYCTNLYAVGAPRIVSWFVRTLLAPAPDFAVGLSNTLAGVLVLRFGATVGAGNLNCPALIGMPNPLANFISATGTFVPPAGFTATGAITTGKSAAAMIGVDGMAPDLTTQNDAQATTTTTMTSPDYTNVIIGVTVSVGVLIIAAIIIAVILRNRNK